MFQILNVRTTGIWLGKAATSIAANELIRREMGTADCPAIRPIIEAIGRRRAYTALAVIYLAVDPVLWVLVRRDQQMRMARHLEEERKRA